MSLRLRLNIFITLLFISLFIGSSFYIIAEARDGVQREVESSARFALQLLQIAIEPVSEVQTRNGQTKLLQSLAQMDEIRHLHIEILNPDNILLPVQSENEVTGNAPEWYVDLVKPSPIEIKRWFYNPSFPPTGIVIRADPTDEIDENWNEVRNILVLLLVFICLANVLVYIVTGRNLSPLKTISNALQTIEKGNYQLELPEFRLPEVAQLSKRFNHMAKVLRKSREENQLLTQRSLQIQEEERRHLAQELHDELGQTITAIKAVAVAISQDANPSPEAVKDNVNTIVEYSDHIYGVAKNMMHRLRPSILDEFGLVKALQHMVDEWNSLQDDVFCHFTFSSVPEDLPETIKISLFRIVQESLTNVLKHAEASEVTISLLYEKGSIKDTINLRVSDNGKGINFDQINPGLGLIGMRERVEMLDGKFEFGPDKHSGLSIDIDIPVTKYEEVYATEN